MVRHQPGKRRTDDQRDGLSEAGVSVHPAHRLDIHCFKFSGISKSNIHNVMRIFQCPRKQRTDRNLSRFDRAWLTRE